MYNQLLEFFFQNKNTLKNNKIKFLISKNVFKKCYIQIRPSIN